MRPPRLPSTSILVPKIFIQKINNEEKINAKNKFLPRFHAYTRPEGNCPGA